MSGGLSRERGSFSKKIALVSTDFVCFRRKWIQSMQCEDFVAQYRSVEGGLMPGIESLRCRAYTEKLGSGCPRFGRVTDRLSGRNRPFILFETFLFSLSHLSSLFYCKKSRLSFFTRRFRVPRIDERKLTLRSGGCVWLDSRNRSFEATHIEVA